MWSWIKLLIPNEILHRKRAGPWGEGEENMVSTWQCIIIRSMDEPRWEEKCAAGSTPGSVLSAEGDSTGITTPWVSSGLRRRARCCYQLQSGGSSGSLLIPVNTATAKLSQRRVVFLQEHLRGRRRLPRLTMYHFSFEWEWELLLDKAPNALDLTVVAHRKL